MGDPTGTAGAGVSRRTNRIGFFLTLLFVIIVIILLPMAFLNLVYEARSQSATTVYNLLTGEEFDFEAEVPANGAFINIAATHLDEARGSMELTVSGHRVCEEPCPSLTAVLYSIGGDAGLRLGLPPSARVNLPDDPSSFTEAIELPVRGWPQRYPFDQYLLTLGVSLHVNLPNGSVLMVGPDMLGEHHAVISFEDRVARMTMAPPVALDSAAISPESGATRLLAVDQITWKRPTYLQTLSILLVMLIAASAIFALSLKKVEDLLLGIGGIILGVWGVRSIIVQTPLWDITWVDIALASIILGLLLAVVIRVAIQFYRKSGFGAGS
jgi:hypothetical protein